MIKDLLRIHLEKESTQIVWYLAKPFTYQAFRIFAIYVFYLSTRFFSSNPHLKNGSFFGLTSAFFPVFGFRPV